MDIIDEDVDASEGAAMSGSSPRTLDVLCPLGLVLRVLFPVSSFPDGDTLERSMPDSKGASPRVKRLPSLGNERKGEVDGAEVESISGDSGSDIVERVRSAALRL